MTNLRSFINQVTGIDEYTRLAFISHNENDITPVSLDENGNIILRHNFDTLEYLGYLVEDLAKELYDQGEAEIYVVPEEEDISKMSYVEELDKGNPYLDWYPIPVIDDARKTVA